MKKIKNLKNNKIDKDTKIILFAVLILLISVVSFNFTGMTGGATWFENAGKYIFGEGTNLGVSNAGLYIIYVVIFIMLLTAFSDIINMFSTFSVSTSWILGVGLAVIAILTGLIRWLAHILLSIIAGWATITIVIALFFMFLAFLLAHVGLGRIVNMLREGKLQGARELASKRALAATRLEAAKGKMLEEEGTQRFGDILFRKRPL